MPEIKLNEKQKAYCRKAEAEGKKSFISHDLLFNFLGGRWVVTNAHTGKEFKVLISEKEEKRNRQREKKKKKV
jgi:hypothetical protein